MPKGQSRREFIHHVAWSSLGGYLVLNTGACQSRRSRKQPANPWQGGHFLSDMEFATLAALCELVLPHDQDPGALDLDVPVFVDRALEDPDHRNRLGLVRKSLFAISKRYQEAHNTSFAAAGADSQAAFFRNWLAEGEQNEEFLLHLVSLTIEGAFGDPSYGGNKGEAGWRMLGYTQDACRPRGRSLPVHKG
jgi:gluconate 2-dehydrogenase gamma chain